ncbi:hypothetical protein HKBW3S42_01965, partial [Candidatus Hakubella thermalkaliphila]
IYLCGAKYGAGNIAFINLLPDVFRRASDRR